MRVTARLAAALGTAALLIALLAIPAGSALAARSGGSGGKHGGTTSSATLVLTPSSPTAYSTVQVSGCGYTVGVPTEIGYDTPTAASVGGITVDSTGCIATSLYVYGAGSYSVGIQQYLNRKWVVLASASFTVQ